MRGSLLIFAYLTRDTLHRWRMRLSSPLTRVLVVFFLSFCGLVFLSSYAISVKVLRERIGRSGADLVIATEVISGGTSVHEMGRTLIPPSSDDYILHLFHEAFLPAQVGSSSSSLVELPPEMARLLPPGSKGGLLVLPEHPTEQRLPVEVDINGYRLRAVSLPERMAGMLRKLWPGGAVLAPAGALPEWWKEGFIRRYVLKINHVDEEHIASWERTLRLLSQLEQRHMTIVSSAALLRELHALERTQYRFRVWVSLGISTIVCLLLTSLSSLEFRHNQYVYALLRSFGVGRSALFLSFLGENVVLVTAGFSGALAALRGAQSYMTETLYRSPGLQWSLRELENDIRTFCLAFSLCILVSGLPILAAICRPVGKVLK